MATADDLKRPAVTFLERLGAFRLNPDSEVAVESWPIIGEAQNR